MGSIDVIMMTSAADAATVQTALRYGVVDYLIKPFQLSRFEEALLTWRNKRREAKRPNPATPTADIDDPAARGSAQDGPRRFAGIDAGKRCAWYANGSIRHQARDFSTNELAAALQNIQSIVP